MSTLEPRLSIILPVFNESENLPLLFERLFPVLGRLEIPFEVIAVDDGSTDESLKVLLEEQRRRRQLSVLSLAHNFGQHAAVLAGFEAARGTWFITLDADLQNPPEEIPNLVGALREGYDLVNTVRRGRQDTAFRRVVSRINGWLTRRMTGVELRDLGCMLRGYHRDVVRPMVRRGEILSFIPALAAIYARNPHEISVSHATRAQGESKYTLWRLLRLELDLMTTFTISPLRLLFSIGIGIAGFSVLFGLVIVLLRLFLGSAWAVEGVFTLFAVLFFLVGAQFVAFGLLGEYLGRIYLEVRERPAYLVRKAYPPPEAPAAREFGADADASQLPGEERFVRRRSP